MGYEEETEEVPGTSLSAGTGVWWFASVTAICVTAYHIAELFAK